MPNTYRVARAQQAQRTPLLNLWCALYLWHHEQCVDLIKKPCRIELEDEIDNYLNTPQCAVFVAMRGDVVCGFIAGQLYELASPLVKTELIGSIDQWYVAKEHRSNGLGKALFDRIEQEFLDYGAKRLNVEVWDFNHNALETYKKKGFQTHIRCMTKALEN
ncbi:N-acetyltransferase [Vibrio inusitatus NBRC 102082]|uniref:N-acetyltransferase n=1 Tax=Vibrio inusitatus NBRC 102082 TaxID=1219070 RepID=A0A4Y3HSZ0_9VIBR|nr:GNAT family N-acetyltransferase [Vibrio inusitatus]GEA50178.1 N-acetyltransferase [Vibrio inusitatus NBRC 102082]